MSRPPGLSAQLQGPLKIWGAQMDTWGALSMANFMLEEAVQAYNNAARGYLKDGLSDMARDTFTRRGQVAALGRDLAWVMNVFSPTAATAWTSLFASPWAGGPGGTIPPGTALREDAKVARVIDGDTFIVEDGRRIRIHGINAPELGTDAGEAARKALEFYIKGETVTLVVVGNVVDIYGRLVRQVLIGPVDIGTLMVAGDYADPYDYQGIAASPEKQLRIRAKGIRHA